MIGEARRMACFKNLSAYPLFALVVTPIESAVIALRERRVEVLVSTHLLFAFARCPMSDNNKKLSVEIDAVYDELRRLAASQMRRERADHTLSATALVNEAYLKLSSSHLEWQDKQHFLGIAVRAMRQILVNHAMAHRAEKRGGDWLKLTLTSSAAEIDIQQANDNGALDVVGLNDALKQLEAIDPRQGRIVELRYFAGLSIEDTAEAMSLSPATIKREWSLARLYLKRALQG